MASQRRKVKGIGAAASRELATIKLNSRKRSGKRHVTSNTVGACREAVAVGGGPSEVGDSIGLALTPIWLSLVRGCPNLDAGKSQQNYYLLVSY